MEQNYVDQLPLRRTRVITRYPSKNEITSLRWSEDTPIIDSEETSQLIPIKLLWTAVAYIPFPNIKWEDVSFSSIPVVSEEQNATLERHDATPVLHFIMWEKGGGHPTKFTNRAFNLSLGIEDDGECEDEWDLYRETDPKRKFAFMAHPYHLLHRSNRRHFFNIKTKEVTTNNLPMLMVRAGEGRITLKNRAELATALIVNALQGRMPRVTAGLATALASIKTVAPFTTWRTSLFDCLHKILWSGSFTALVDTIVQEFTIWCQSIYHYPVWALATGSTQGTPKSAFIACVNDTAALYDHDYGLPHLSSDPFVEETRMLHCDAEQREFVWKSGHTRSTILNSDWVKRQLHIRSNTTMEVKTKYSISGESLNLFADETVAH